MPLGPGLLLPPQGVYLACCYLLSLGAPLGKNYTKPLKESYRCVLTVIFFKHMWIKDAA